MTKLQNSPRALLVPLVVLVAALGGCGDDPLVDHEEEIATIRLTVGGQTVEIDHDGGAQDGLTLPRESSAVTAVFFAADGDELELHDDEFELRLVSQDAGIVTFARTGAFSGTLTGVAAGNAIVKVSLFHFGENHDDFGPHDLVVTVQ